MRRKEGGGASDPVVRGVVINVSSGVSKIGTCSLNIGHHVVSVCPSAATSRRHTRTRERVCARERERLLSLDSERGRESDQREIIRKQCPER